MVEHVHHGAEGRIEALHAGGGEPLQIDGKEQHQHHTEPERGHAVEHHGEVGDDVILNAVFVLCRRHPQQGAEDDGDYLAEQHQHQRDLHLLRQELAHRELKQEGVAQISLEGVLDVDQQLLPQGQVQPELGPQLRDVLVRGCFSGHNRGRITGRQVDDEKAEADDGQNNRHHLQEPPQDVLTKFHLSVSPF